MGEKKKLTEKQISDLLVEVDDLRERLYAIAKTLDENSSGSSLVSKIERAADMILEFEDEHYYYMRDSHYEGYDSD